MIQRILHSRHFLACLLSAATGMTLYFRAPFQEDNIFLRVIAIRSASAFLFFKYSYTLFLDTTPYIAYSILLSGIYIFALKAGRKIRAGKLPLYPNPRKGQNFLSWLARYITPVSKGLRKRRAGWSSRNEAFSLVSPSWARSALENRQVACTPSPSRFWPIATKDYCGADNDDPIYYARHTVMKPQAELQRQSGGEQAGEDQRTPAKEIALDPLRTAV
jgi:hypothetical protein